MYCSDILPSESEKIFQHRANEEFVVDKVIDTLSPCAQKEFYQQDMIVEVVFAH